MTDLVKKEAPGALAKWDAELEAAAVEAADHEAGGGRFVSLANGIISINDSPVKDNKLTCVVVDYIYENALYKNALEGRPFNRAIKEPVVCFALARPEDATEMAPHDDSTMPQCADCAGCVHNQFPKPPATGGKACKNTRRLALVALGPNGPRDIVDGEVLYMKLPVTSVKIWAQYVKGLKAVIKRPPFGVVTTISARPDPKTQFKVFFNCEAPLGDEYREAIMQKRTIVMENIAFPYAANTAPTPEAAPRALKSDK